MEFSCVRCRVVTDCTDYICDLQPTPGALAEMAKVNTLSQEETSESP